MILIVDARYMHRLKGCTCTIMSMHRQIIVHRTGPMTESQHALIYPSKFRRHPVMGSLPMFR